MFSNSVKIFSFAGFDIKLDPSWLLIAALITWSLAQQYFPSTMPGLSQQTYLMMGVFAMLCFFASLLLHEMSHSVVARHFGIEIKGIREGIQSIKVHPSVITQLFAKEQGYRTEQVFNVVHKFSDARFRSSSGTKFKCIEVALKWTFVREVARPAYSGCHLCQRQRTGFELILERHDC